jgi:hypothetical protein
VGKMLAAALPSLHANPRALVISHTHARAVGDPGLNDGGGGAGVVVGQLLEETEVGVGAAPPGGIDWLMGRAARWGHALFLSGGLRLR